MGRRQRQAIDESPHRQLRVSDDGPIAEHGLAKSHQRLVGIFDTGVLRIVKMPRPIKSC